MTGAQAVAEPHPFIEKPVLAPYADPAPAFAEAAAPVGFGAVPPLNAWAFLIGQEEKPVENEPPPWEGSVTGTGEATARIPEPEPVSEPEVVDPVRQQIVTVAEWLEEAEEHGRRLSGAEVARRLNVSPKTGQRRVLAAAAYLAEQRQTPDHPPLRAVRP
ncbi:hypothetical protein [Streptomyces sp. NPDC054975]